MTRTTNTALKAEADHLLESGLGAVLAEYGDTHLVGSYALDLMTWRDLDIHLVPATLDLANFFRLGQNIATLLRPHRMHFRNETATATPGLPCGFYWGVYLGDERAGAWKLDVWASPQAELDRVLAHGQAIRERLRPSDRQAILDIKTACWQHPEYRRAFSSADVYDAVLDRGIRDIGGFWTHLENSRGVRRVDQVGTGAAAALRTMRAIATRRPNGSPGG